MDTNIDQKTAIIYCRVSSKEQVEGTSLENQERICREYAARQNIKVLKVFVEQGESAKTTNRTEFNKALIYVTTKKNKVNYFLVYKIDRFARNQDDHVSVRAILKRAEVELRSATEQIDSSSMGRLTEGMLSVFAEFDNNVRTERSRSGMLERVKQGIWMWPEPLGYCRPAQGSNIAPDPKTAPLILLAFEEYAKGTYTYKRLANFLADRGLKTRTGKRPKAQLIEKIIKNPVYCGLINVWGGYEGTFEPIVSKELFYKCQEGYTSSTHIAPRSANNPLFPLRGTICVACGESISGSSSTGRKGKKYPYYHHANVKCVNVRSIPKETFEQSFVEYLNEITPSNKYEKLFKSVVVDTWQSNYKKMNEANLKVQKEIQTLERDLQKVFESQRKGLYNDEEFLEQKEHIKKRINEKRLLLQENWIEEFNMDEALEYCFGFVRTTTKTWLEADYQSKLRFQKLVCKGNIEFDGEKFGTAELSSIYRINKELSQNKKTSFQKSSYLVSHLGG